MVSLYQVGDTAEQTLDKLEEFVKGLLMESFNSELIALSIASPTNLHTQSSNVGSMVSV